MTSGLEQPAEYDNAEMFNDSMADPKAQPDPEPVAPPPASGRGGFWYQRKFMPAFWTISSAFSMVVNLILIVVIVILLQELFVLKDLVNGQLLGGLYENFVKMDEASIQTTVIVNDEILVNDTIPVVFTLPLEQNTTVILTEDTPIIGATVDINTPFFSVSNANTNIVLPAGTELPIFLNIDVPVDQTIPINITVPINLEIPVTIPLNETELHEPFVGLQEVVGPYYNLIGDTPDSWEEAACKAGPLLCSIFGGEQ